MSKKVVVEYSRYPVAFAAIFVQIFLIILLFIFSTVAFAGNDQNRISVFAGIMAYGFVTNIFLSFTLWEVGFSIREEQVRGTLESLYLSPANKFSNLLSRIFAILGWTTIMVVGGLALVSLVVGGLPANNVGTAFVVLLLTISGFLGIGFLFAGVTIKLKESAQLLVSGLQFFFMIFSAQFFPFSVLPDPVKNYVSRWLPVSYNVDLFRSTLLDTPTELAPWGVEFLIVLAFGLVSPLVGYWVYNWIERRARTEGTLGEY